MRPLQLFTFLARHFSAGRAKHGHWVTNVPLHFYRSPSAHFGQCPSTSRRMTGEAGRSARSGRNITRLFVVSD